MSNFITPEGFEKTFRFGSMILEGTVVTVLLALFTVVIGFILGIVLAIMRMSDVRPLRFLGQDRQGRLRNNRFLLTVSKFNPLSAIATTYVEVIRSTPVLVQIMINRFGTD